jgi:hypothetical protein
VARPRGSQEAAHCFREPTTVSLLTRLYVPSGDVAEPAYAAKTNHWASSMKRETGPQGCIRRLGIAGTTCWLGVGTDRRRHQPAARRPRAAGAGRPRADRSLGSSLGRGRMARIEAASAAISNRALLRSRATELGRAESVAPLGWPSPRFRVKTHSWLCRSGRHGEKVHHTHRAAASPYTYGEADFVDRVGHSISWHIVSSPDASHFAKLARSR